MDGIRLRLIIGRVSSIKNTFKSLCNDVAVVFTRLAF